MRISFGYITAPTKKEAQEIALELIEEGLVACVNILPGVESYFVWKEQIMKENEVILIFKAPEKNQNSIIKEVKKIHSYETPCITFLPLSGGNSDSLRWVEKSCK